MARVEVKKIYEANIKMQKTGADVLPLAASVARF